MLWSLCLFISYLVFHAGFRKQSKAKLSLRPCRHLPHFVHRFCCDIRHNCTRLDFYGVSTVVGNPHRITCLVIVSTTHDLGARIRAFERNHVWAEDTYLSCCESSLPCVQMLATAACCVEAGQHMILVWSKQNNEHIHFPPRNHPGIPKDSP